MSFSAFIFAENALAVDCGTKKGSCTGVTSGEMGTFCPLGKTEDGAGLSACKKTQDDYNKAHPSATQTFLCCYTDATATQPGAAGTGTGTAAGGTGTPSSGSGAAVSLADVSPVGDLTGAAGIATLVGRILKAVLGTVGAIALLIFVYGGFLMLASSGKPENINKGKEALVWAIIGLIVILTSYVLSDFIIKGIMSGVPSSGGGGAGSPAGTASDGEKAGSTTCQGEIPNCTPGKTSTGAYSCCDCGNTSDTKGLTCQDPGTNPQNIVALHCGTGSKVCAGSAAAPGSVPTTPKENMCEKNAYKCKDACATGEINESAYDSYCSAPTPLCCNKICPFYYMGVSDKCNGVGQACYETGCNQGDANLRGKCFANCARDQGVTCQVNLCLKYGKSVICCGPSS